jgi:rhodanese-related sulfurtransferase
MAAYTQVLKRVLAPIPNISPGEAYRRIQDEPYALVVDVRAAENARATGSMPGALSIPLGTLAARTVYDVRLRDRSRPIIVTCQAGYNAARAARLLEALGYSDVSYVEGGMRAWREAGLPTAPPEESRREINQ